MSDRVEKTCPLCAEEMDLTDQQLKPCKCGYEVCVWCWHHIMEMAEKDNTEGRCPACRTPYDKEKIVGTTANCERLVAEINMEKKKSQKTKAKSSEGRKQLSSVRVIQRNLVYIMGLPLHVGDEDLLHRREYFGQYGKVLKVSMSRTAAGVIQQFPNSTCSVYITYSKEEEAVRCIQSVHGYILEGRPLRACFGTTKYCHAWLRNMPCSNPDCLYLHEVGSQEDSFTKDEIISAYTRNRVQQINDPANSQQRRSGNMLPPPVDDYDSSVLTVKPSIKNPSSNVITSNKGSPPNESSERAIGLPPAASWAARASNSQPPAASLVSPNGPLKQKSDATDSGVTSAADASIAHNSSSHNCIPKKPTSHDEHDSIQPKDQVDGLKPFNNYIGVDPHSASWENSSFDDAPSSANVGSYVHSHASMASECEITLPSKSSSSLDRIGQSKGPVLEDVRSVYADGHVENLCSEMSAMGFNKNTMSQSCSLVSSGQSLSEINLTRSLDIHGQQLSLMERYKESLSSLAVGKAPLSTSENYMPSNQCDWMVDSQNQALKISPEIEEDILSFDNQRLKDPEVMSRPSYFSHSSKLLNVADHSRSHSLQYRGHHAPNASSYSFSVDNNANNTSSQHEFNGKLVANGLPESLDQSSMVRSTKDHSLTYKNDGNKIMGMHQRDAGINGDVSLNTGENSIISDILSLDFDPWDESSTSDMTNWLGDSDIKHDSLDRISKSMKVHTNNQSRFSFARQEEPIIQPIHAGMFPVFGQISESHTFSPSDNHGSLTETFGFANGLSSNSYGKADNLGTGQNAIFPNKISASRYPVSAPPGFSVPSRSPPPGFSQERLEQAYGLTSGNNLLDASSGFPQERIEQAYGLTSGNLMLDTSTLLRNSYQTQKPGSIGNIGHIFTNSANMEVSGGRPNSGPNNLGFDIRSGYPQQLAAIDNEARLQLLLKRSIGQQQSLRYSDIRDNYSLLHDSYGINSRLADQPQVNNISPFSQLSLQQQQSRNLPVSNGNWDRWNDVSVENSLGMADLLRNERLGINKFHFGYEDREFRIPCSGDLYSRTFGM